MPLVAKGSFAAATATGNQVVTGVGFTPKAIIFWTDRLTATGYGTGAALQLGAVTSTTGRWSVSCFSDEAAATSNTGRSNRNDRCIEILGSGTPTTESAADIVSFDPNGFTINWAAVGASAWIVHFMAFGGDDLVGAQAGTFTSAAATGAQAITGVGFQPDFLLFGGDAAAANFLGTNANVLFGMAARLSGQAGVSFRDTDAVASMAVASGQRTTIPLTAISSSAATIAIQGTVQSYDPNGFTLNWTTAAAQPFYYLALKGGNYFVGVESTRAIGFKPTGFLAMSWGLATNTAADFTQARIAVHGADGTNKGGAWIQSQGGVTPSNTDSRTQTDKAIGMSTQNTTTDGEADVTFDQGDGFTLNWTTADATAREFVFAAFGVPAGSFVTANIGPTVRLPGAFKRPTTDAFVLPPPTGTTFFQSITAAGVGVTTFNLQTNKNLPATGVGAATMTRFVGKNLAASGVGAATIVKQANKILGATGTGVATISGSLLKLVSITATGVGTATMSRSVLKNLTGTGTGTATLTRLVAKNISATGTGSPTFLKLTGKTMTTSGTGAATMTRQTGKKLNAAGTGTPTFLKLIQKTLSTSGTGVASLSTSVTTVTPPGDS